ncbi:MAG: GIY-YIG nuclease family protein [Pirellulaceae bacterium]
MTSIINHTPTEFEAFGASFISDRAIGEPAHFLIPDELPNARRELRNLCLEQPGIYGWLNQDRQLIYVGKSKSLKHRLLSYFLTTPSDPKMGANTGATQRRLSGNLSLMNYSLYFENKN